MGKRFVDSALWTKPWFRKLPPDEKAAWHYLTAMCDNVGVWDADTELADFTIGAEIDWNSLVEKCNGNIEVMENGKWWLVDFCDFQYGELSAECRPHQSYIKLLQKHGLKGYTKGIHTPKEKDKDKDKDKDKEKDKEKRGRKRPRADARHPDFDVPMNQSRFDKLVAEHGIRLVNWAFQERIDWEGKNGKPDAADYASAAAGWISKAKEFGKLPTFPPDAGPVKTRSEIRKELGI